MKEGMSKEMVEVWIFLIDLQKRAENDHQAISFVSPRCFLAYVV